MRLLTLAFAFCLSIASAYADSSCDPVSNAYLALTKIPNFTIYVAPVTKLSQKEIEMQGRSDGIYKLDSIDGDCFSTMPLVKKQMSLVKKQERDEFSQETQDRIQIRWSGERAKCTLNTEDVSNGKTMLVYVNSGDRIWIGKNDGLLYQILSDKKLYTIVYGAS